MDTDAKNVCLIGVLHILGYMLYSYDPLMNAWVLLNGEENFSGNPFVHLAIVGFYVFLSLLAGLMIYGVVKQRYSLVAPFLIISFVALIGLIIIFFTKEYLYYYHRKSALYTIGVQIMMLFPIYSLFLELRSKAQMEKTPAEPYCAADKEEIVDVLKQKLNLRHNKSNNIC